MPTYYFALGNTPQLSLAELTTYYPQAVFEKVTTHLVRSDNLPSHFDPEQAIANLAGTVKIIEEISTSSQALEEITDYLSNLNSKPVFSLTAIGQSEKELPSSKQVKDNLKNRGLASRYLESPEQGLSAAVLLHQSQVQDLFLISMENEMTFAKTKAVQDINLWTLKDRSKPYSDKSRGMLPPKVARMMVNIGIKLFQTKNHQLPTNIYDPFCGSGTILMEATSYPLNIIGSDLRQEAAAGTQENLDWIQEQLSLKAKQVSIFKADVSSKEISHKLAQKVDLIVTEGFLGQPKPNPQKLANIFKGLHKLYKGAFKNWTSILAPGSIVVVALPSSYNKQQKFDMSSLIDDIKALGYNNVLEPIEYFRPQAITKRQIFILEYNP